MRVTRNRRTSLEVLEDTLQPAPAKKHVLLGHEATCISFSASTAGLMTDEGLAVDRQTG